MGFFGSMVFNAASKHVFFKNGHSAQYPSWRIGYNSGSIAIFYCS